MRELKSIEAQLRWVSVDRAAAGKGELAVLPEPFPPREPGDITELASSVRLHGILCPLLLREAGGSLQIVCGYRRFLAARRAGLSRVPALVRSLGDAEAIRCFLSDDIFRRPLDQQVRDEALKRLRGLRDGPQADGLPKPEEGSSEPRRLEDGGSRQRPAGAAARSAVAIPLGPEVPTAALLPAEAPPFGRRVIMPARDASGEMNELCAATEAFLETVGADRAIPAGMAEDIVDRLLVLLHTSPPLALLRLYGGERRRFTAPHSLLVAALCEHYARSRGWDEEARRQIVRGGFLHDVGMVFLDQGGLLVPGGLNEAMRTLLPSHTRIGYALIGATRAFGEEVAVAARDHHERWNGSGYPEGKAGDDVPVFGRILAYLDTFAALVSPRPHRDALEAPRAAARLESASRMGLLDPRLLGDVLRALAEAECVPAAAGRPAARLLSPAVERPIAGWEGEALVTAPADPGDEPVAGV